MLYNEIYCFRLCSRNLGTQLVFYCVLVYFLQTPILAALESNQAQLCAMLVGQLKAYHNEQIQDSFFANTSAFPAGLLDPGLVWLKYAYDNKLGSCVLAMLKFVYSVDDAE